jgi:hypothetical protein
MQKIPFHDALLQTNLGQSISQSKRKIQDYAFQIESRIRGFQDFFQFPFDISQPMPSSAPKVLVEIVELLNSNNVDYWVAEGTLLGIIRDNKLIPHDTDLDFYLVDTKYVDLLHEILTDMGFSVGRLLKHRGRIYQLTYYNSENLLVDFLFWKKLHNRKFQWIGPEIKGRRIQDASYYHTYTSISWNGVSMRTFRQYRVWLELVYGKNWLIPESQKGDWTKSIGDLS